MKDLWNKTKTVLAQVAMFGILIGTLVTGFWFLLKWLQRKTDITTLPTTDSKTIGVTNPNGVQDGKDSTSLQKAIEAILQYGK